MKKSFLTFTDSDQSDKRDSVLSQTSKGGLGSFREGKGLLYSLHRRKVGSREERLASSLLIGVIVFGEREEGSKIDRRHLSPHVNAEDWSLPFTNSQ
jgi:hypothetical protein